jgi:hypothetical protein
MSVHAFFFPYLVLDARVFGLVLGKLFLHEGVVSRPLLFGRLGYGRGTKSSRDVSGIVSSVHVSLVV